ncbi:MAG TPA: hypothetical protein VF552_09805 [Allosphingosinicella sp.]|jgi:hypothetical protein
MGTRRIDGTVEAIWLKQRRSKVAVYDKIRFRLADGSTHMLGKSVVGAAVADRLVPGTSGRFYLYSAIDHQGVHGIRSGGRADFDFPTLNETAMRTLALLNGTWLGIAVAVTGKVPLLPLFLTAVTVPGYFLYRRTRGEARRQFEADSGFPG